jgi:hypothetical protein
MLNLSFKLGSYPLKIGLVFSVSFIVGVADIVTGLS